MGDPASINKNLVLFKVKCKKRLIHLKMNINRLIEQRIAVAKSSDFLGFSGRAESLSLWEVTHAPGKK